MPWSFKAGGDNSFSSPLLRSGRERSVYRNVVSADRSGAVGNRRHDIAPDATLAARVVGFACLIGIILIFSTVGRPGTLSVEASSLFSVLDTDGRIKPGSTGSFDPKGFQMSYGQTASRVSFPKAGRAPRRRRAPVNDGWYDGFGIPGANGVVFSAASDGAGNIYIGGGFTAAGNVFANRIAKWDGTSWSAARNRNE